MKKNDISYKKFLLVISGLFLLSALVSFIVTYRNLDSDVFPSFGNSPVENWILFYLNFYISFFLLILSLWGSIFCTLRFLKIFLPISSFVFAILSSYIFNDLFTIKFCIFAAYIIINTVVFTPIKSILANGLSILLYSILLSRPSFMGIGSGNFSFNDNPHFLQMYVFIILLGSIAAMTAYIKCISENNKNSSDTVKHLDSIITQLSIFNHRLQEYAKTSSEEAIRTDRLRFTSDLHDKCGYVYTIIITLAEAAISYGEPIPEKVQIALEKIRKQAKEGLQQTRETLFMIREMQEPWDGSIDVIYKMKSIFEDITGIKVEVESGNIRQNYGKNINKVLVRILQEAFTNSIRHGKANHILIHFWELPNELTMTVTDNGIGSQTIVKRIGLAGMEERLATVGGNIEISSPIEGGFRIRVRIPITTMERDESIMMEETVNGRSGSAYSIGR